MVTTAPATGAVSAFSNQTTTAAGTAGDLAGTIDSSSTIALTAGGPGISSDMPAVFMTQMAFHRSEIGLASASAIMMFLTVSAIVVPYLYSELKREDARK